MFDPSLDGKTHINIYSRGKTALGRWMSNFAYNPILIPEHGEFASIEAYWYWLGCLEEHLRELSGADAKKAGRATLRTIVRDDFEDLIKAAIDIKIESNPEMKGLLIASTLPFAHYYVMYGRVIDAGYGWITEHWMKRREELQCESN